jgi:hypothetical protein
LLPEILKGQFLELCLHKKGGNRVKQMVMRLSSKEMIQYLAVTDKLPFQVRVVILDPKGEYVLNSLQYGIFPSGERAKPFVSSKPH